METETIGDVKTSSTSSDATSTQDQQAKTDVTQTSSTVKADVNKGQESIEDVKQSIIDKHFGKKDDKSSESSEGAVPNKNETEKAKEGEGKEDAAATEKHEENVPYARFKEKVDEAQTLKSEIESKYKPDLERLSNIETYCTKNKVSSDDFNRSLELAALVQSNPEEALKRLQIITDGLRMQLGQALPADLQKEVDEGVISKEAAAREAKLRIEVAQSRQGAEKSQQTQQQDQQRELQRSLNAWTESKSKLDPDFAPKKNEKDADGKYEQAFAKFIYYWNTVPVKTVAEAVGLMERAYNDVNGFVKRFTPPPPARKTVSSTRSSTTKTNEQIDVSKPGWARKVVADRLTKV